MNKLSNIECHVVRMIYNLAYEVSGSFGLEMKDALKEIIYVSSKLNETFLLQERIHEN